ncbi:SPOSA6832_01552, partial [Sporobolomyces salmonicolor]
MDEPGFHARRREEREQRRAARDGKLGLHGIKATQPLVDEGASKEHLTQNISEPNAVEASVSGAYEVPAYRPGPHVNQEDIPGPSPINGPPSTVPIAEPLKHPENSKRRMSPYLSLMLGATLRYDTVIDHVWHGFAMIVTTDEVSDYSSPPTMTLEWDATGGALATEFEKMNLAGSVPPPADHPDYVTSQKSVGQRIHTYMSIAGGQSFWRFKIEIPLGEREEEIFYSINGGPENSFWVPAATQEMRVMYHSWSVLFSFFFAHVPLITGDDSNGFSAGVDTAAFNGPDPLWRDVLRKHDEKPIHCMVGGGDQIYCDPLTREPEIAPWISESSTHKKANAPLTPEMRFALDRFFFNWRVCCTARGSEAALSAKRSQKSLCSTCSTTIDGFGSYPDELQTSPVFSSIGAAGYRWFLLFQSAFLRSFFQLHAHVFSPVFIVDEVDGTLPDENGIVSSHPNKSLILGGDGVFIPFSNHSFLSYLGPKMYILAVDWRSERRVDQLASNMTYDRLFAAVRALPAGVQHLVVLLGTTPPPRFPIYAVAHLPKSFLPTGVPIAYPRMVALEAILESKFNPMSLLAKAHIMPSGVNKFNAEAELKDDLADHPCADGHKKERNWLIETLQKLAVDKHLRISFMSGDVHAKQGSYPSFDVSLSPRRTDLTFRRPQFFSTKKVEPAKDPKYMLQIISSAIVNTPPPPAVIWLVSKLGSKKHKTLHYIDTEEELIPLFTEDTDGSKPKSTTVMGRRNYCMANYNEATDELEFTLCIEKRQGSGTTKGYSLAAPPPRW